MTIFLALLAIAAVQGADAPDDLAKLDRCKAAVHGDLASAPLVCAPSSEPVDIWRPETFSDACRSALRAGVDAGKVGPNLPDVMRQGLVDRFDTAVQKCLEPEPTAPLPRRDGVRLWD